MTVAPDLVRRFRDANPVLPDQELPEFLALARPSVAEIMDLEPPRLAPTWRRTGLVAVAAAFVIALAVAIPLILFGGGDPQVADEPETTTSTTQAATTTTTFAPPVTAPVPPTTTTLPPEASDEGILPVEFSYPAGAVPPFHATLLWERRFDGMPVDFYGTTSTIEVWAESPLRFRWQVVENDGGATGISLVADGERMAQIRPDSGDFFEWPLFHYLAWMYWEPEGPHVFDWSATCADDIEVFESEPIAERAVRHVRCTQLAGDWELWVDVETGLVLKLIGEMGIDDQHMGTSPDGGFEVVAIEFFDGPIPGSEALFAVEPAGPPSFTPPEVPALHAVIVDEWGLVKELWHESRDRWREEWEPADTSFAWFRMVADGAATTYYANTGDGYENAYLIEDAARRYPSGAGLPGDELAYIPDLDACTPIGADVIGGRPATGWRCEQEGLVEDVWLDSVSGLKLQRVLSGPAIEQQFEGEIEELAWTVIELEIDPAFSPDLFVFEPEPGWCDLSQSDECDRDTWAGTRLRGGEEVPPFVGTTVTGEPFDLTDLRGKPVIVFFWMMGDHRPETLERQLFDFATLHERWGDRVTFVSANDTNLLDEVTLISERLGLAYDVVACQPNDTEVTQDPVTGEWKIGTLCRPAGADPDWSPDWSALEDLWQLWSYSPVWFTIDADGNAVDLIRETDASIEEVETLVATVAD